MPCRDYEDDHRPTYMDEYHEQLRRANQLEAMLCAVMNEIEDTTALRENGFEGFLDDVDWKEAGVKKGQLSAWWSEHRVKDHKRKVSERKAQVRKVKAAKDKKQLEETQKAVFTKLHALFSKDELKAIGIKKK